jgi:hypothetical protein
MRHSALTLIAVFIAILTPLLGNVTPTSAAVTPVNGTMVEGSLTGTTGPALTLPRGAVWVKDGLPGAAGGHWWVTDAISGICRVDPTGAANPPQFTLTNCNGAVKSGGQIAVGDVPGSTTTKYFYVADASSKSIKVARITFTVATGTLGASLVFNVQNNTQKGGGLAGGRPVALALVTSPGITIPATVAKTCTNLTTGAGGGWPSALAAGEQDLLVSYIKSGDVIRVFNVNQTTATTPCQTQIGSSSDGLGVNSFALVGNDLYLGEVGGLGLSKIVDPTGITRAPCVNCSAVTVPNVVGFPGGMASDGSRYLYIGDVRTASPTNSVYRYDTTTGAVDLYSNNITPSYTAKDSNQITKTFTQYIFPLGLGYRADTGELYVADDPQFLAAVVTNQQGHLWRVPFTPVVSSVNPNSAAAGGITVTIAGQGFITAAGATQFTFGGVAATGVTCASMTSCTAIVPNGSGTVDVTASVTVPGMPFPATTGTLAGGFTYTTAVAPTVTGIAPAIGSFAGGTVVTITGTGFDTVPGNTSVAFGGVVATNVSCSSSTSCTATSPASAVGKTGISVVDVVVSVGGLSSATSPADQFTYDTAPAVTSLSPNSGPDTGGTTVTINGTGFDTVGVTTVTFGGVVATNVLCSTTTSCSATSPAGTGTVDVIVTDAGGSSTVVPADQFTYVAVTTPTITGVAPSSGSIAGGTVVAITGTNFDTVGANTVTFGANTATNVSCASATSCTATSPAGAAGTVDIIISNVNGTSVASAADKFTYAVPTAGLYAWGITAPKGGAVWLPGALGGHWWSSDHAQGLCRQDPVPGTTLHAINFAVCGDDTIGSAGQAVYDPRPVVVGATAFANLHYVYVPDNAVRSTAVWRLTFNATTETMVADPIDGVTFATAMTPLADVRTLKPNGMALGPLNPDGSLNTASPVFGLYVTDLVERYVRVVTNPGGDPRTQTINIVAATGDGKGANGTQGFIGNYLYVSGNRAAQFFDVTLCPSVGNTVPPATPACGMASVPAPAGAFISGTAVDVAHKLVYLSDSPGTANAIISRHDSSADVYVPFPDGAWNTPGSGVVRDLNGVVHCEAGTFGGVVNAGIGCNVGPDSLLYVQNGQLPAQGSPNATVYCALTCTRPWDTANHPIGAPATFAFAFGLAVGPNSELIITEDPSAGARSGRGTMWTVPFVP